MVESPRIGQGDAAVTSVEGPVYVMTPESKQRRDRLKLVVAVVIPVALAAVLVMSLGGRDGGGSAAVASSTTTTSLSAAAGWASGKAPTGSFTADLDRLLPRFVDVRDKVAAIPPPKKAPAARVEYAASANLSVEAARVYRAAVEPGAEPLKGQLDLLARRLRALADRIYDRGRVAVDPSAVNPDQTPDVELRLPAEVPDWGAEGLAAGPPLETGPPPPGSFPTRQETRPEEPVSAWSKRVQSLEVPPPTELAAAIEAGDAARLGALARRYAEATAALRAAPDPVGGRERGAVAELDLLVYGEAARAAQAATLVPGDSAGRLSAVATRLALVGDALRDPVFGKEKSGFDEKLLHDTALRGDDLLVVGGLDMRPHDGLAPSHILRHRHIARYMVHYIDGGRNCTEQGGTQSKRAGRTACRSAVFPRVRSLDDPLKVGTRVRIPLGLRKSK